MKGQLISGLKFAAVLLAAATFGFGQASVSGPAAYQPESNAATYATAPGAHQQAVPGTINYVEGQATLNGEPLGANAAVSTLVQPNEPIDTQTGYVEVLLTPGAFLRIGNNSEVVMQSIGLANIQMRVVRGSAMIEAADLVKGTNMEVSIGGADTQIEKRGLYDFDANQKMVRVLDGKAKVLEASRVKDVDKGDQLIFTDAKLKTHGFDKQVAESDPLYVWSKARSEAEAQSNVRVAQNVAVYGGWYGPGWYWDPFWSDYAFLPGAGFLYSPFGWGFYSPGFVYAAPIYRGYYVRGFYGRGYYAHVPAGTFHGFAGGFHGRR